MAVGTMATSRVVYTSNFLENNAGMARQRGFAAGSSRLT